MATLRGGERLNASLRQMASKVAEPVTTRIGFLENARYPDGTSVAMIAAINEWGKPPTQPPRPFFRTMIENKQDEWPEAIKDLLVENDLDAEKAFDLTGAAIAGQLRQSIVDLVSPPLAPSTIAKKGHDKPLIDTGHMLASVDHELKTGA